MLKQFLLFLFPREKDLRIKYNRYTELFEVQQADGFGFKTLKYCKDIEEANKKLKWFENKSINTLKARN